MESPYFERSRYRTDYHCKVLLYSALKSHEVYPILKQLARQNATDERFLSRDNMGYSSPLKYDSRDSQLPNPIPIVVPLTEPANKEESNLANLNIKVHVKNPQISQQELIIDAALEFHANSLVDFVILLFDLSDRSSFEALDSLFQEFMKDHSAVHLAEPSRILAVGKVQSQEIHQLVFRDEIDLWCSRQKESPNISFTYFEYSMVYSQGAHDLLALITEPFQTMYTTQLSRGKSLESPISNRNSVGTGFFHSSFAQGKEKNNDGNFGANGFSVFDNGKVPRPEYSLSAEQQRQRSISAPLYDYHAQDDISKSDLIEMEEDKKRYERQRKWQDMEFQMRLMLETDQLEEDRLAEIEEQERLQQQQQQQQNLDSEPSTSFPSSPLNQQQQRPTSSTIMSNALGFFRNIPPLSPSSHQSKTNANANVSTAPSLSLSLHAPFPTISHLSTTSSSSGLSPQPPPPPGCSPSSPSVATHKEIFDHSGQMNSKLPSSGFGNSSLKSRSEDTYDCNPNTRPVSKQTKTPTVHGSNVVPFPTDLRMRPVSTSTLRLPPLPGNTPPSNSNAPHLTINTSVANYSSANSGVSSPASALIPPSTTATSGNASNNNIAVAASSSSSSISIMQSVLKRTGSMFSQASQRTSSQMSLRSRLSSRNTMNSNSRASSCLDLQAPSVDDINVLIETMHTAVKSEQELFQRTMYLYGASGSDLLLLSSEDEDDKNGEESDEEKSANSSRHGRGFYANHSQPSSNPSQTIPKSPKNISPKQRSPHPVHNNSRTNVSSHSSNIPTNANSSTHNSSSSGPYRSYISDLSTTSSRYTQSSLEERGLIDPERLSHWMTGNAHNNHHSSSANNSPPFPGLNHLSQKNQEDMVVASLLSRGNSGQVGHSSQDKEEEDRILDIIVGLSPSTDMMSSPPSSSRKRLSSRTSKRRSKEDNHQGTVEIIDQHGTNSSKAKEDGNDKDQGEMKKPPHLEEIPSKSNRRTESVFIIGCGCM